MSGLQYKIRDYLLIDDIYSHKNGRISDLHSILCEKAAFKEQLLQCEPIVFDIYTYVYKWRRKGSRTMTIIGVRAEKEGTWE